MVGSMSKTKIQLENPFAALWKFGYLVSSQGRRSVCLWNSKSDRTTISYARYLMSVHLGRLLSDHEHVDHIDNDKTNDVISNLQILTLLENNRKHATAIAKGPTMVEYICPVCSNYFSIRKGVSHLVESYKYRLKVCSNDCKAKSVSLHSGLEKIERFAVNERSYVRTFRNKD